MIEPHALARLPLFQDTPPEVVAMLANIALELRLSANSVVFLAGSAPRGWYVVLEGKVRVVRASGSRQHVVHTEESGGTMGEVPLFAGGVHPATAITAEPTRLALFQRPVLEQAMTNSPAIALLLLRRLALRVRGLVERLDDRSSHSVHTRLSEFLCERHRLGRGRSFSLGMTQQQLAEELGTAREVVSRELLRLRREGVIESLGGGRFRMVGQEAGTPSTE